MATVQSFDFTLNNGVIMPVVGLGVFKSEPKETVQAVRSAISSGYRLIDTASVYRNEREVGEGIRAAGVPRAEIFVTTKVWMTDYGFDRTLRAFDKSLAQLGFDSVDMYLVHWPVPSAFEATVETYKAAMRLLDEGRARAIGVSNFRPEDLKRLVDRTGHVPAVNQIELHPFFNQPQIRACDTELGIVTQSWSPIGGVNRYGRNASDAQQDPLAHPVILGLAAKYAKTPAQIILRWQIDLGNSPIPKSVRPARIAENLDVFDFSLGQDEVRSITALDTGARGGPDPADVGPETFPVKI